MATIVLQAVGSAIGGSLGGPIGAIIGRTAGAVAGSYIDQKLFGPEDRKVVGPRLGSAGILSSREGSPIPRVYGQARISGEIIWATRFKEVQSTQTQSQGGKGGGGPKTTTTSFSYYANFAVAVCEGEIASIRRIWADGKLLDQNRYTIRTYRGTSDQMPDSLIEAKQGVGNTPSYRDTAYLVFEELPLKDFGNRIPQIAIEVVRPIGQLERHVYAVNMIPGATEFGYDTQIVSDRIDGIETRRLNVNQTSGYTDFLASLDELIAICPNLKQISLVIAWFGNDLRANHCEIYPAVETSARNIFQGEEWAVAGIQRIQARLVSQNIGLPNYGGTPSDNSVLRAIAAIKARGIRVCLNPFVMMDIPPENQLPDPYGNTKQNEFPWRGRITCDPAPSQSGSVDGSQLATVQVEQFLGGATPDDVTVNGSLVGHAASLDWSYRRMILHYARLAQIAGGVDMFLIGSEFRGLTTVRGQNDAFPFVSGLETLAQDVRSVLGTTCQITYGADWSEYFGYHPTDGSGDVFFHLDDLWTSSAIDVVGIDNYMPLSDWRSDGDPSGESRTANDVSSLARNITRGEGFDWHYPTVEDRLSGTRSPITDGLGKPWVYRFKDFKEWWGQLHYNRKNGIEDTEPTGWAPNSKPIVFTEFGCAAIDKGANQPNVFFDPKSSESAAPYFSDGGRDDGAMLNYIAAHQAHWDSAHTDFSDTNNPVSPSDGQRMVDFDVCALWAWDARPYPAFPDHIDTWSDAINWNTGHWLNGRLGSLRIADLIADLLRQSGIEHFDTSQVEGVATGYVIAEIASARDALEVILNLYGLTVFEDEGLLSFRTDGINQLTEVENGDALELGSQASIVMGRAQESDLPLSVRLHHIDASISYQETETDALRINGSTLQQERLSASLIIEPYRVQPLLANWLQERWTARETLSLSLPNSFLHLTLGDHIALQSTGDAASDNQPQRWEISRVESGEALRITAKAVEIGRSASATGGYSQATAQSNTGKSAPRLQFLDLPPLGRSEETQFNLVAATARPWPGELAVYVSSTLEDFSYRQSISNAAFIGVVDGTHPPTNVTSRWSRSASLDIRMLVGQLSSASEIGVLGGSNALAVLSALGSWEIIQFSKAELIAEKTWRLTGLLRGQAGTEKEASAGCDTGAAVVLLNSAVLPLVLSSGDLGVELHWQVGPVGSELGSAEFTAASYSPGYRGLLPFRPAHLKAGRGVTNELVLEWTRRDRLESDDWSPLDIPMSEASEKYLVALKNDTGSLLELEVQQPSATLSQAELNSAFGPQSQNLTIQVFQVSATQGPGSAAQITFDIN